MDNSKVWHPPADAEQDLFADDSGFSPYRLTLARYRRRMSQKDLAAALSVTGAAVTRFENGTLSPAREHIDSLARILSIPQGFLLGDGMSALGPESISFRARRTMPAAVRDRTIASGVIAAQTLSPLLRRRFTMPRMNFEDLSEYADNPQCGARHLREFWKLGVGPIKNMVRLLEAAGVEVYWINEPSPSVDAVSFWYDDRPYILLNESVTAGDRLRFNLAHELAHLVLHRQESSLDGREIESAADEFASAFLLPSEQFYHECPGPLVLSNFFPLKRRWGVSIQAMIRRARDIGAIKDWQYERACKEIGMAGWRAQEPAPIACEESVLHARVYASLRAKGETPAHLATRVQLDLQRDLLELMPIGRHYLTDEGAIAYEATAARPTVGSRAVVVEMDGRGKDSVAGRRSKAPARTRSPLPPRPETGEGYEHFRRIRDQLARDFD